MTHYPTQFSNSKYYTNSRAVPGFKYILALVFLLFGYIGLSNAAPTPNSEEKHAQTNTNTSTSEKWAKGRLLITPRAGLAMQEMQETLRPHGVRPKHHIKELNLHICELPDGADEVKVMRMLKKDDRFKDIELDMLVAPDLSVTDPSLGSSWALPKIQAPSAWDNANGDGIIIAILDSGVNSTHPDLAANMVPGWNFYHDNADTTDIHGHGTKVAGAAAAAANNGTGSAGVAWGASIMPIRISNDKGYAFLSTMAQGIRWAADNGAKVANISFSGAAGSSTVQSAADYMRSKGGIVVVSAGNTGGLLDYAASDSLLVASATNSNDQRPSWSSYGPFVDVSAPGVSIYTTTRTGGYSNVSGTSFSSPIVAATAALMLSANNDLTPTDIAQILKSTAIDLGASGFDNYYGTGRINATAAVAAASALISTDDQAPTITITKPTGGQISGIVPIDINYSDNVGVVRVELHVNGQKIITDTQSPFAFSWDTTSWSDGAYLLTAVAFDAAGNETTSSIVAVTVNNAPPPVTNAAVTITSPTNGQQVSGIVPINVSYTGDAAIVRVEFHVKNLKLLTDTQAPYAFSWDTTRWGNGSYLITAHAFDAAGNESVSPIVAVTINHNATTDTQAPVVTITAPIGGETSNTVTISANATDNIGVTRVEFFLNEQKIATDTAAPFAVSWDTTTFTDGNYTLTVKAFDAAGNIGTSANVSVSVNNAPPTDTIAPTVAITAPTGGEVSDTLTVSANATDNVGVTRVEFFLNGQKITTDTSAPFAVSWNTTTFTDGNYTLTAKAFDAAGNMGTSANVSVTVNNAPPTDTIAPTVAIAAPTGGEVSGTLTVSANATDDVGVTRVEFFLNGQKITADTSAPFAVSWNTTTFNNGSHTITAKAFDAAGNMGTSANVSVTVNNAPTNASQFKITAKVIGAGRMNLSEGEYLINIDGNRDYKWFAFYPQPGHKIDKVILNGINVGTPTSYTVHNAQGADQQLEVYFVPKLGSGILYEITASAGAHGTITSSGVNQVTEHGSLAFTISPNNGYEVDQILIDGVALSNPTLTYTFSDVTVDHTIHVSFKEIDTSAPPQQFTITANVISAGGRMNLSEGEHIVKINGSRDYKWFAFYPQPGHKIDKVVLNNVNVGTPSSYTVHNAGGVDQTLEVYFAQK